MKKIITILALVLMIVLLPAVASCGTRKIDSDGVPPEAVVEGELVLFLSYLRVNSIHTDDSYLLVWPEGYSWHSDNRQVLIDDIDGHTVAGVGDIIVVSGEETTALVAEEHIGKTLERWIKAPYWLVTKVVTRTSRPYISRDEVISIASEIVPPEVVVRARLMAILRPDHRPDAIWQVQFLHADVTRDKP